MEHNTEVFLKHVSEVSEDTGYLPPADIRKAQLNFFEKADIALYEIEKTVAGSSKREDQIKIYESFLSTYPKIFGQEAVEMVSWLKHWESTNGKIHGAFAHVPSATIFAKYSWIMLHRLYQAIEQPHFLELSEIGSDVMTRFDRLVQIDEEDFSKAKK